MGNVSNNTVIIGDEPTHYLSPVLRRYEKTTNDDELVDGLWGMRGSSDNQAKIWVSSGTATENKVLYLFVKQRTSAGYDSNHIRDNGYAHDGWGVDHVAQGPIICKVPLLNGQSVSQGNEVQVTTGGKTALRTTGQKVGIALEAVTASGADADLTIMVTLNMDHKIFVEETITVTANSGVLTNVPFFIEYIERTQGTATGGCTLITAGTVAAGEAKLVRSTGTISFHASDAVSQMKAGYWY